MCAHSLNRELVGLLPAGVCQQVQQVIVLGVILGHLLHLPPSVGYALIPGIKGHSPLGICRSLGPAKLKLPRKGRGGHFSIFSHNQRVTVS
jgi:hypothetical protein